ncbi:hypothetical protein [Acinetobacter guillouiae]|uniref:hypothetical protein n=1 Tax=Acinetobacter guillouiae TaxID=106649 RepID=UPI003AF6BB7F
MPNKAVLLDLENNMPTAKMLRDIIEHYPTLYLFNCTGQFQYSLEDLTEFSGWVSSGQVVILEVPNASEKEYEYAVVVGQLLALLEPKMQIEVISAMPSCSLLLDLMRSADLECSFIQVQSTLERQRNKYSIPSLQTIQNKPYLQMVKKYCDALGEMTGKPNTIEKLKNSIVNILQVVPEKAQHFVGMLINLKIVKRFDDQVAYRKKVLKQWTSLDIDKPVSAHRTETESAAQSNIKLEKIDQILEKLRIDSDQVLQEMDQQDSVGAVHQVLFKNFAKIDPVQIEVIHKLNNLKTDKPKDIYELRDLLEQMFPKSDIRLLLKELIEKGYIYWNGHEVVYSHEMYLN